MTAPRNVTPDDERQRVSEAEAWRRTGSGEWSGWSWHRRGRDIPWLGILLLLIGGALLIQYVAPTVSVGTLLLLAVGIAFIAGSILGRSWFWMVPGILLIALGAAELAEDLALFGPAGEDVPGLASSALAVGFLVIWLAGYASNRRSMWPLWGAAIFGLVGLAQLSGRLVNLPQLNFLWPLVIIAAGVLLILGSRRR